MTIFSQYDHYEHEKCLFDSLAVRFAHDGYVTTKGWIPPREVKSILRVIQQLLRSPHEPSCSRPNNLLLPLRWSDATVQQLLASERRVQLLPEALAAEDLRWISGYFSIKEEHSGPLWWHQDWWCWDHPASFQRRAPQVAVLCYLTNTDQASGALRVLPGPHHKGIPLHASLLEISDGGSDEPVALESPAMSEHPEQVTLPAEPGDAVLIDYRLLHGTFSNASPLRRDCVILNFLRPGARCLTKSART